MHSQGRCECSALPVKFLNTHSLMVHREMNTSTLPKRSGITKEQTRPSEAGGPNRESEQTLAMHSSSSSSSTP